MQCAFVPGAFPATPPEPADVDAFQADLVYRFDAARRIHGADVVKATLRAAEYLSKKPRRRVLHLEFDLPPDVAYDPGDCLAVPCANSPAVVDAMLRVTGLSGDEVVQVWRWPLPDVVFVVVMRGGRCRRWSFSRSRRPPFDGR